MWPFKNRKHESVHLDELAYSRWLRAQRPDFLWFLALQDEEQEVLASIGDQYVADDKMALSYALKDPQVAELGARLVAGDTEAEMTLLQKVAQQRDQPKRETMGGMGARTIAREMAHRAKKNSGRSFLGRRPDQDAP
jgi:hypothetical protein